MLATRPQARRRGVAHRLLEDCVQRLRTRGIVSLFLEVGEGNAPARGLYASESFMEAGRRKGYYAKPGGAAEDAIVMRRVIGP